MFPHTLELEGGFQAPPYHNLRGVPGSPYANWMGSLTGVRFQVPITEKWFTCSSVPNWQYTLML